MARSYIWLFPAILVAALVSLLCWGAWVYGYDPLSYTSARTWWQPILATNQNWTILLTLALLLVGLGVYWLPRRRERTPIGLVTVVVFVLTAAVLGTVSYIPCRGQVSGTGMMFWILQLYVGQPPSIYQNTAPETSAAVTACTGAPPLALQLGQIIGLGATLIGALAVGSVLWRKPLDRLQSRFASEATIFTGLSPLTLPLLRKLAKDARNPRAIIVIEQDDKNPLLEEAKNTSVRVVIGPPDSSNILRPIISALRGCALVYLYALSDKVADNEAVLKSAAGILERFKPDRNRQPHLVALIDDPRHADRWRGARSGRSGGWFEDALSTAEVTARSLVFQVLRRQPQHLIVCGDSTLTVPILVELARRAWEQVELVKAMGIGRAAAPHLVPQDPPALLPIKEVTLLDVRSRDIKREYLKSAPAAILDSLPDIAIATTRWHRALQRRLDALSPAEARDIAVIITEEPPGSGVHEAGRIARLCPETSVFVLAASGDAEGGPVFDLLHPFEPGLLINGEAPEDTWVRVARHWHECHRLSHPVPTGHAKEATRRPWRDLAQFVREDNILQLRSILMEVAALGRQWVPVHTVAEGSVVDLGEEEVANIAVAEHRRWLERKRADGQFGGNVVPWEELSSDAQRVAISDLCSQLSQLKDVGFVPVIPAGGPATAASFERFGLVWARRLTEPLSWTSYTGETMHAQPGDWRITDEAGHLRTATDRDFKSSHEPAGDGRWRRTGTFRAWQVNQAVVVRTKEGNATARKDDWVVEAPSGERWPVQDQQFRWSYRPIGPAQSDPPELADRPATSVAGRSDSGA